MLNYYFPETTLLLCYVGKPTLYGSLTCQGIGQDGIPEVTASEGFIVNEINKVGFYIL